MTRPTCLGKQNPNCTATRHGTRAAYHKGCRCPHAREDRRIYDKRLREARQPAGYVDATGARRRLQALNAIGWTFEDLAPRLHTKPSHLRAIARGAESAQKLYRTTADRITDLYRQLAGVPGPSQISRSRAAAKGWLSPVWWDNIDDPDEQPDQHLRHEQRYQQFVALHTAGVSQRQIRLQLRVDRSTYLHLVARHTAEQTCGEVVA